MVLNAIGEDREVGGVVLVCRERKKCVFLGWLEREKNGRVSHVQGTSAGGFFGFPLFLVDG